MTNYYVDISGNYIGAFDGITGINLSAYTQVSSPPVSASQTWNGTSWIGSLAPVPVTNVNGNSGTATVLQTSRNINSIAFDGSSNITIAAVAGTLTGTTLASNVVSSSLTSVGTLAALTVTATITGSVSGNAGTVTTINGMVSAGSGITLTGSGTSGSPYSIATTAVTVYNPADQTITSAGNLTLTHGLGSMPLRTQCFIVCQTAENGFSIGDIIDLHNTGNNYNGSLSSNLGLLIVPTATQLYIRYGNNSSVFAVPNKTTGVITTLNNANWKLRIYSKATL